MAREFLYDIAVSRAYYVMFYCAEALLDADGLTFSSHAAVVSGFGRHFAKTGRVPSELRRHLIVAASRERTSRAFDDPGPGSARDITEIRPARDMTQFRPARDITEIVGTVPWAAEGWTVPLRRFRIVSQARHRASQTGNSHPTRHYNYDNSPKPRKSALTLASTTGCPKSGPYPPGHPGYGPPEHPRYGTPEHPRYGTPEHPGYGIPEHPGYGLPERPRYGLPERPRYGSPEHPRDGPPDAPRYGIPDASGGPRSCLHATGLPSNFP